MEASTVLIKDNDVHAGALLSPSEVMDCEMAYTAWIFGLPGGERYTAAREYPEPAAPDLAPEPPPRPRTRRFRERRPATGYWDEPAR